ncbi:MAG TPA: DUF3301 domain-containing protein [Oleiagrimonas sp.]|nr:DUF3301 domain-containing protein [Oleiagrimonas sp.]
MPVEMLALLVLVVAIGIWLDTMRQREHALHEARRVCADHGVQLLDHSVGLSALKLRRHDGHLAWERHYSFEVSTDGSNRVGGSLWLRHGHLAGVSAAWLKPASDARPIDADAKVTSLLDRIPRDRSL